MNVVTFDRSVVFSTNKAGRHDIIEILFKVALNTIKTKPKPLIMRSRVPDDEVIPEKCHTH